MSQVVVTGHRLQRLGGYHLDQALQVFSTCLLRERTSVDMVHTGGALGFDQAIAFACIGLSIPFTVHVPFKGYHKSWPEPTQLKYKWLMSLADEIVIHSDEKDYNPALLLARNIGMVDHARLLCDNTELWALWDGGMQGGTWHTVNYAEGLKLPTWQLWERWERFYGTEV